MELRIVLTPDEHVPAASSGWLTTPRLSLERNARKGNEAGVASGSLHSRRHLRFMPGVAAPVAMPRVSCDDAEAVNPGHVFVGGADAPALAARSLPAPRLAAWFKRR